MITQLVLIVALWISANAVVVALRWRVVKKRETTLDGGEFEARSGLERHL